MVEYDRTQEREHSISAPVRICVVGIGGAGLNVLDRIALDRIVDATLIGMHTDVRVLSHAMTQHKLQLGTSIMRGIGSGGDPELGRTAAEDSAESIRSLIQGHDMVFLCAGLGGGTASGAVPVVAQIAKDCGALVFIFATTPFSFEGRRRLVQAELALEQLQSCSDALILFENNRMGELVLPKEGIQKAFSQADQLIGHSVRAIASMVTQPGLVRLSLSDLMSALRSPNARCLFGFGEARGNNRVAEALKKALKSPLIHQGQLLQHSQNLIVHVAGGETLTFAEVEGLMKQLGKHIPDQTQILFGISVDAKLGDSLALTLLSSLSAQQMACELHPAQHEPAAPAAPVEQQPAPVSKARATHRVAVEAPPLELAPTPPAPAPVAREPELVVETTPPAAEIAPAPVAAKAKPAAAPVPKARATEPALEEPVLELAPPPAARKPEPAPAPAPLLDPEPEPAPAAAAPAPTAPARSIFTALDEEAEEEVAEAPQLPVASVVPKPASRPQVQAKAPAYPPTRREEPEEPVLQPAHGMIPEEEEEEASAAQPEPALAATGPSNPMLQPTLNLHQEEIARFKGTTKTIVEGEDLDVPTWMRMRQKTRR